MIGKHSRAKEIIDYYKSSTQNRFKNSIDIDPKKLSNYEKALIVYELYPPARRLAYMEILMIIVLMIWLIYSIYNGFPLEEIIVPFIVPVLGSILLMLLG